MNGTKQIYMEVLYHTKNKQTVDSMTFEELCAFYHMMIMEVNARSGK